MWHGVCEPLWMHPYCHPSEEAHWGPALPLPQKHPWAVGCPHPTSTACLRGFSGDLLTYLYPTPSLPHTLGFSSSFAFLSSSPFPGLWGPFHHTPHPPITVSELQRGGSWLWEGSGRRFTSWLESSLQHRGREPTSLRVASGPSIDEGRALPQVASRGARWLSVLGNLNTCGGNETPPKVGSWVSVKQE